VPPAKDAPENTFSEALLHGFCDTAAEVGIADEWATCLPAAHYFRLPRDGAIEGAAPKLYHAWLRSYLRTGSLTAGAVSERTMVQELEARGSSHGGAIEVRSSACMSTPFSL